LFLEWSLSNYSLTLFKVLPKFDPEHEMHHREIMSIFLTAYTTIKIPSAYVSLSGALTPNQLFKPPNWTLRPLKTLQSTLAA